MAPFVKFVCVGIVVSAAVLLPAYVTAATFTAPKGTYAIEAMNIYKYYVSYQLIRESKLERSEAKSTVAQ